MNRHELKCWPEMFDAVERGEKTWEFRRDDRGFKVGDTLVLQWWDPAPHFSTGTPEGYGYEDGPTRKHIERVVTFILHGGRFGVPEGFCVMSIEPRDDPRAAWRNDVKDTPEDARLWMLEVISCDEQLGDDGMCACAREHFDQLAAKDAEIEQLRAEVKKLKAELKNKKPKYYDDHPYSDWKTQARKNAAEIMTRQRKEE